MTQTGDLTEIARGRPHWPALDGLRGTAILAVLICHYAVLLPPSPIQGLLQLGWAGVDLFFVLSGFLITGILIDARGEPNYFRNFYARRMLRIFPLYFGVIVITLLVGLIVRLTPGAHEGLEQLWAVQPSLWTFTANYWMPAQSQWSPWLDMFAPLWSLSVEEQFYLVWPLVVFRLSRRALVRVCVGVIVGALLLRLGLTKAGVDWRWHYFLTPTRADALAIGALLALIVRHPDGLRRVRRVGVFVGIIAFVLVIVLHGGFNPFQHPWKRALLYSPLAVLFASLLLWSIDGRAFAAFLGFYSTAPLRSLGRYSYGLYILHMPVLYLTMFAGKRWGMYDITQPTWPAGSVLIGVNVLLCGTAAVVSFHFYEKPFLKLKRLFPSSAAYRPARIAQACAVDVQH